MRWLRSGIVSAVPVRFDRLGVDTGTACALTGVSIRQINHWDRFMLVQPSILPARGSGSRRRFALEDVVLLAVVRRLRRFNLKLDPIAVVLRAVGAAEVELDVPDTLMIVGSDESVWIGRDREAAIVAADRAASAIMLNLSVICRQLFDACRLYFGGVGHTIASAGTDLSSAPLANQPAPRGPSSERIDTSSDRTETNSDPFKYVERQKIRRRARADRHAKRRHRGKPSTHRPAASAWGESW